MGFTIKWVSVIVVALSCACTAGHESEVLFECPEAISKVRLVVVDTLDITVPEDAFPYYDQVFLHGKILYGLKAGRYKFDLFNLEQKAYLRSIQLDPNFVQNLGAFYVHNTDSIFITEELTFVLLVNDSGEIIDRFDLGRAPLSWTGSFETPEYFFFSKSRAGIYYNAARKNLVVTFTSPEIWYYKKRSHFQMHGVYNIQEKKWVSVFGQLPEPYSTYGVAYPFMLSNPYCLSLGDTSYVTFPMSKDIFVYHTITGKLIRRVCGDSDFLTLAKPYNYSQIENLELEREFLMTSGWYGPLQWHEKKKIFSRTLILNAKSNSQDDKREKAIIFFDKNLRRIGQHLFDQHGTFAGVGGEGFSFGFATPNGFVGSLKKNYYSSDDQLRYTIKFEIQF